MACFQSTVCNLRKTESHAVEVGCLPGVADPEFDVVNAFQLEWILHSLALRRPSSHILPWRPAPRKVSKLQTEPFNPESRSAHLNRHAFPTLLPYTPAHSRHTTPLPPTSNHNSTHTD